MRDTVRIYLLLAPGTVIKRDGFDFCPGPQVDNTRLKGEVDHEKDSGFAVYSLVVSVMLACGGRGCRRKD
jgi:hypothetical protein